MIYGTKTSHFSESVGGFTRLLLQTDKNTHFPINVSSQFSVFHFHTEYEVVLTHKCRIMGRRPLGNSSVRAWRLESVATYLLRSKIGESNAEAFRL